MNTKANTNNVRLRELIEGAGLTQTEALALFNAGMVKPYSVSAWKAYLGDPDSARWRPFDAALLKHAEKIFGKLQKKACRGAQVHYD